MVIQPSEGPGSYSEKICITMPLSSSTEMGPPPRWRMVTADWTQIPGAQLCCLTTNQSKKKKKSHKPWSPHPKCCLLFLGTSDSHAIRSPVWSLSISSLRGANSSKLNCYYYKGECWFQAKKYLDLDQVERDFCSARQIYAHAQQEEVTEERYLRLNSQEESWVWCLSQGSF